MNLESKSADFADLTDFTRSIWEICAICGCARTWRKGCSASKVRMMAMFTCTARLQFNTLESMATPCSVNAQGR
jgi:hypothetical protein